MIFGGDDHKVYLGCLNCSEFSTDSVLNRFGPNGSRFSSESIFDKFGDYGSKFSDTSPCDQFASHPPVIVDNFGNYYGELTINEYNINRTRSAALVHWLQGVCQ